MKDRFMGENTHLLYDLMHYLEENNKTGLLFTNNKWVRRKRVTLSAASF
jgi:hypothetical protein